MVATYVEYMKRNPDAVIIGGADLDHDMEYDERSGWEICNRCGGQENEIDDTCPESIYAVTFVADWQEYEEVAPGVARHMRDAEGEGT